MNKIFLVVFIILFSNSVFSTEALNAQPEKQREYKKLDLNQFNNIDSNQKGFGPKAHTTCKNKFGTEFKSGTKGFDDCLREMNFKQTSSTSSSDESSVGFSISTDGK